MVRTAAINIYLASVFGILSLNHVTLGYCHCFQTIFCTECGCYENSRSQSECSDCCCTSHEQHCPCEEERPCSTWFFFELNEFTNGELKTELTSQVVSSRPVFFSRNSLALPKIWDAHRARWYDNTGPPADTIPVRLRYSVFLI